MADPARIASLTAALAEELAANTVTVAWRTLAAEAAARGFPSSRAFREWCQRTGVTIREAGGVALVAVVAGVRGDLALALLDGAGEHAARIAVDLAAAVCGAQTRARETGT